MTKASTWTNTKRILRSGFFNFWRDGTVSLASVLVMTITLMTIGGMTIMGAILDTSLNELRNKIDINITFVTSAEEEEILKMKSDLEVLPEVLLVTYITREEALASFKARHANEPSILAALDELGENPLGAVLNIKARDPSQYESVATFLEGDGSLSNEGVSIIDNINYFQNKVAIDRLTTIISTVDRLDVIISLALTIISILIAFNTIRLTIYIARDEISVMRLVGASKSYVQGPFIVVGVMYGLVAGVLTLLVFIPITYWISGLTTNFFSGFSVFEYYLRNLPQMMLVVLASGIFIGSVSSFLAARKYLRV